MYTQGSDSDFLHFLEMAGRNEITNIVYIDCAGTIKKFLNREAVNSDLSMDMLFAINSNYIVTIDHERMDFVRLIFNPKNKYCREGHFDMKECNLNDLLKL